MVEKVATPGGGKSTTRCTGGKGSSQPVNDATIELSNRTKIINATAKFLPSRGRNLILDIFENSLVKVQRMLREPRYEYLQGRAWYELAEALRG